MKFFSSTLTQNLMQNLVLSSFFITFLNFGLFAQLDDSTVATVNGVKITKKQYSDALKNSLVYVSGKKVTKESVLDELISRELGIQKALKAGLDKDEQVKRKMQDVLYHAQISKDMEGQLKTIEVTDQDVKDYYAQHPEYRTAQILFRMRAAPTDNEQKEALKKAMEVYKQVKIKPDTFYDLASKYSQSSTAPSGGDIGFQPAVRLAPEYYQAIRNKKIGTITSPVRSQYGYHIIKVVGKKDFKDINMNAYKKIVYDVKRNQMLAKYFKSLQKGAKISINKDFLKRLNL